MKLEEEKRRTKMPVVMLLSKPVHSRTTLTPEGSSAAALMRAALCWGVSPAG